MLFGWVVIVGLAALTTAALLSGSSTVSRGAPEAGRKVPSITRHSSRDKTRFVHGRIAFSSFGSIFFIGAGFLKFPQHKYTVRWRTLSRSGDFRKQKKPEPKAPGIGLMSPVFHLVSGQVSTAPLSADVTSAA